MNAPEQHPPRPTPFAADRERVRRVVRSRLREMGAIRTPDRDDCPFCNPALRGGPDVRGIQ